MPADGSGTPELLLDRAEIQRPGSWSPDGTVLAFNDIQPDTSNDIWVLEDGVPRAFIATEARERWPMFSPDGQWIAYDSDQSGRREVYRAPYPGPGGEEQVSTEGGRHPAWSSDGRELFFRTEEGRVMSVSNPNGPSAAWGVPQTLFEISNMPQGITFDVHPDGERFVVVRRSAGATSATPIGIVLNWLRD